MTSPTVSVILPFYRDPLVPEAVRSILSQSFGDLELIALDDGSDNGVAELLRPIDDPRLKLVICERNGGISVTRNRGIEMARGRYIAFMDSDDVSYPRRIERQVEHLERNPSVAGCGTGCHYGEHKVEQLLPSDPIHLRWEMIFNSHVIMPTIMVRSETAKSTPFREFLACEDYLWLHDIMQRHDFANLPEILFHYRIQPNSLSIVKADAQRRNGNVCRALFAADAGVECDEQAAGLLEWLGWPRHESWPSTRHLRDAADLLRRLVREFDRRHPDHGQPIAESAMARLRYAATVSAALGPGAYLSWLSLSRSFPGRRTSLEPGLFLKCLLHRSPLRIRKFRAP